MAFELAGLSRGAARSASRSGPTTIGSGQGWEKVLPSASMRRSSWKDEGACYFSVFSGRQKIPMPRIRMLLAISRHFFSPFPGLGVNGVAPPTLLPWLLLCGRSSAVYRTVLAAIGFVC